MPRFFFGATPMASRKKRERLKKMAWSNDYRRGVFRKGRVMWWEVGHVAIFGTSTCRNAQKTVATIQKQILKKMVSWRVIETCQVAFGQLS